MKNLEKYGLKTGEGLADVVDYKEFDIEEIRLEIQNMGFMSDFHTFNDDIKAYTGTHMLIVADREAVYGDNWMLCVDESVSEGVKNAELVKIAEEEARVQALADEQARLVAEEEARRNAVYEDKPMVVRAWESETADTTVAEVENLSVKLDRPLLGMTITRRRRDCKCKYQKRERQEHHHTSREAPHHTICCRQPVAFFSS
jgi:hypothetical protein